MADGNEHINKNVYAYTYSWWNLSAYGKHLCGLPQSCSKSSLTQMYNKVVKYHLFIY